MSKMASAKVKVKQGIIIMEKAKFEELLIKANYANGNYKNLYKKGLSKAFYGDNYIVDGEEILLSEDSERGRAYRAGLTGQEPELSGYHGNQNAVKFEEKKGAVVNIRMTAAQKNALFEQAKRSKQNASDFVINLIKSSVDDDLKKSFL